MRMTPRRRSSARAPLSKVEALEGRRLMASGGPVATALPIASAVVSPTPSNPTGSPQVSFVQFEPLTGRVLVSFTGDLAGYDASKLTDPANYNLSLVHSAGKLPGAGTSRPRAGVVLAPTFRVTGATLANQVAPGMTESVVVSVDNNQPLRDGVYRFTIRAAGVTDLAGRPLDGAYFGTFPSGSGQPGGDFTANLSLVRNTVQPALPTTNQPAPSGSTGVKPRYVFVPSVSGVRVRYGPAFRGTFRLAGGNNIALYVNSGQFFPGTFQPLAKGAPAVHAASGSRGHSK